MKSRRDISFESKKKVIAYRGETVVDLTHVPEKAAATVYSKVDFDSPGLTTTMVFNKSRCHFDFHLFSLSPVGLIAAIVENRLEVEGMKCNGKLREAYERFRHGM